MKKTYTKINDYVCIPRAFKRKLSPLFFGVVALVISLSSRAQVVTSTLNYSGAAQNFTVPACVGSLSVTLSGASGGSGYSNYSSGGLGGRVFAVVSVTPGQVLQFFIGGAGGNAGVGAGGAAGYNGGGVGKTWGSSGGGGGGGGGTDLRIAPYAISNRILVAGGGGGGAYNYSTTDYDKGGPGGGTTGGSGFGGNSQTGTGVGSGGTQSAGGTGGTYPSYCTASSGSLGLGAAGGGTCNNTGGGGGGGYYGGGGGVWAGGGGGSNFAISTASSVTHTQGVQSGNGVAIISYSPGFYVAPMVTSVGTNTVCAGLTISLSIPPTSVTFTNYSWSNGGSTASVAVTPTSSGVYSMTANNATCTVVSTVSLTTISSLPSLTVANTNSTAPVCEGRTVNLTASGAATYTWSGPSIVTNGVAFTPSVTGDYTVVGQNVCGTSTAVTSVSVSPAPSISISVLTGSICSGNTTTIVVNGNYVTNTITTTVAAPQVTSNVGFVPSVSNTYIATGTSANGCTAAVNASLQVVQSPTLAPTSTTLNLCTGKSATLNATGATGYTWTTGSSTIANTSSVVVNPTVSTTYTITRQNSSCLSTQSITINVSSSPTVGAVALTGSICSGNSTSVSVTGNAVTHTWTSVLAGPTVSSNISFTPAVTNTYVVTGSSAGGCTANATATIQVVQTPTLAPTSTTLLLCIGKSAVLTATGATGGYTWTSGTSTLANTPTLAITPNSTTTYSITKNSSTCFDTKAITIQVNSLTPVFAAASSTLVCASKPTTLSAFGGVAYTWSSSAAPSFSFSNSSNPVVSPSVNTTYTVAASDGTCINTAVVSVSTNPNPTINVVTSGTTVCIGSVVTLTASGGINYTWTSVPATPTVTGTDNIAPNFTASGAYAFNVTGDNIYNCTSGNVAVIIVNSPPTVSASATKSVICSGNSTTLTVNGANVVQWDANANSATTASTIVNPTATTVYNVSGTLSATGCSSSTNVVVYIYTPSISILSPTNTCYGSAVTLTGQVNNPSSGAVNSYTWSGPGIPPNSLGQSVVVTPTVLSVYTLSAKSTTQGNLVCVEQKTTSLGIYYNPTITVAPTRTFICRNEPVDLVAFGGLNYTWNNNSFAGTTITVSHANVGTVAYTVVGTDANGCTNDTIYYLKINGCQGLEEFNQNQLNISVYPNPNNGAFTIVSEGAATLQLINELGQVVKRLELSPLQNHQVEVADLAKGMYFLTGSNGEAVTRQKIIVK